MKRTKDIYMFIGLLAAALLLLAMFPAEGLALTSAEICASPTNADYDSDGFSDTDECNGLYVSNGASLDFTGYSYGTPGTDYLDPATPDLFVILVSASDLDPGSTSLFPPNPFEFVSAMGINIHQITAAQAGIGGCTRCITPIQKAVRITESLDTTGDIIGVANYGTPNGLDYATVYSQRITNFVNDVCTGAISCTDGISGLSGTENIIPLYIKHTISHECGHMLLLTDTYNARFGGYHHKSGSAVVMEQSVTYTSKGKAGSAKVTFYISTEHALADYPQFN